MATVQSIAHRFEDKERSDDVKVQEELDFSALLLSSPVQNGLTKAGFVKPSPIQLQAIPLGKFGLDLIVQAKSGTGKTCIFAVVALENIILECSSVQTLVLAPTREIASQICDVILSIGSCMQSLSCHYFIGGLPVAADRVKLKRCQIAVGTPGRIKQLIECKYLNTNFVRLFVLDEADKLLDKNFQQPINWIYQKLPHNKQMLALSATYPESLAKLLVNYMRNPAFVRLNTQKPALLGISQFYTVTKFHPLSHVTFQYKFHVLSDILTNIPFSQCLIFINLQSRAELLCYELNKQGWASTYICGNQDQVQRLRTMAQLKSFQCRILVTTDLTARGIDCQNVDVVINVDLPIDLETYLHRIGRAGRFGSKALAITIISEGKEKDTLFSMNSTASLDILELPKPFSSNVWNSNTKEGHFCHTGNTKLAKTNDSMIYILNDELFNDENSNDIDSSTIKTLMDTEHNASHSQDVNSGESINSNKHCLIEADATSSINSSKHCKVALSSVNEKLDEKTEIIPNIFPDLQQYNDNEQIDLSVGTEEQENCKEVTKHLTKVPESSNDMVSNHPIKQIGSGENNNNVSKVDDFSEYYKVQPCARNISYAEIIEELDNIHVGSEFEKYKEYIPSENLLQKVKCILDTSNCQHWKCLDSNVAGYGHIVSQEIGNGSSFKDELVAEANIDTKALFCNTLAEIRPNNGDYETSNVKVISLTEPRHTNSTEALLHESATTEEIILEAVDVVKCSSNISMIELTKSSNEKNHMPCETHTSSPLSITDNPDLNDDIDVISLPVMGHKPINTYEKFCLPKAHTAARTNTATATSELCIRSINSVTSDDELDDNYSSYSESGETTSKENMCLNAEKYCEYIPQDIFTQERLPCWGTYSSPQTSENNMQQSNCTCRKNAKELSSNLNLYGKCFFTEDKRCFEHLSCTPDCWKQSDYGYCSAQAEYNHTTYSQNYAESGTCMNCNQCEKKLFSYPNVYTLPSEIHGNIGLVNNSCCKYCYWQSCYSYSQDWCYLYTRYMSGMLKHWKKFQKHGKYMNDP